MKKTYSLAIAALLCYLSSSAQNWITITDESGTDVTNGSTSLWMWTDSNMEVDLTTLVTSGGGRVVKVRRYETSVQPGSRNYFCWNVCYLEQEAGTFPVFESPDPQLLDQGTPFSGFHAYHVPDGTQGYNTYRYVWFDVNQPSDSAFVDIVFGNSLGLEETPTVERFTLSPNPANGQVAVSFNLSGGAADAIVLHNALGAQVLNSKLSAAQRSSAVNTASLPEGLYFVSLQQRGRTLATQRLVVTR